MSLQQYEHISKFIQLARLDSKRIGARMKIYGEREEETGDWLYYASPTHRCSKCKPRRKR
jgi:hypothetical protein